MLRTQGTHLVKNAKLTLSLGGVKKDETACKEFWTEAVDEVLIVAVTDEAGTILYANSKFCEISGYSMTELIGANHRILNSRTHDRTFFADMFRVIRSGQVWRGEICNRSKDGRIYWVDTTIIPHLDDDGKVARYVACRFDITKQKEAQELLRQMAVTDPLTGLMNRAGYNERIAETVEHCARGNETAGILIVDIDNFKDINDIYGHETGDEVIRIVAERIRSAVRPYDIVARLGGDEFALVLTKCPTEAFAAGLLEAIQTAIQMPLGLGNVHKSVSASIGLACFPQDGISADDLMRNADIALYLAKRNGKARHECFTKAIGHAIRLRVDMLDQARAGLPLGEFELFYQPLTYLADGSLHSFEALLRWNHPTLGLISPGRFADLFNDNRLASAIGLFVQETAVRHAAQWRGEGVDFGKLAINTTAIDFETPDFVDSLLSALSRHGLRASDIAIEVREDMFLGKSAVEVRRELGRLDRDGFEIAFDDFGTGYASLTHLKELPLDRIKIDRSFIVSIATDPTDQKIVRALIELVHSLGYTATAEGIETDAQRRLLTELGCDRMQGYLVSRPVPAVEVPAIVRRLAKPK